MTNINIDKNAHKMLTHAKTKMKESGINSPNHSDAIRWLFRRAYEHEEI